jgi:hypothetical protein
MALNPSTTVINRRTAFALGALAFVGPAILGMFPAAAQQTSLPPKQCEDAISISTAIMTKYQGRISAKLADSFGRFRDSRCDLGTQFTRVEGTADEVAFGEFRVRLIAMRTAANNPTATLVKN